MAINGNNNNGFTTPGRISWAAVSAVLLAIAQFIAVILWASGEHSSRVALENRFNEFKTSQDNRNREQDITINRVDEVGTRPGQLIAERQLNVLRRMDQLEQRMRASEDFLRGRQSRENFKPEDFRPSPQWPQP